VTSADQEPQNGAASAADSALPRWAAGWQDRLAALLAGRHAPPPPNTDVNSGAEIVAVSPDGNELWRAALARTYRLGGGLADDAPHDPVDLEADLCWIRPLVGGYRPLEDTVDYAFHLDIARPRGLPLHQVDLRPAAEPPAAPEDGLHPEHDVVFTLPTGGHVRIQPARGKQLVELARWDTFTLVTLDGPTEAALELLQDMGQWQTWA